MSDVEAIIKSSLDSIRGEADNGAEEATGGEETRPDEETGGEEGGEPVEGANAAEEDGEGEAKVIESDGEETPEVKAAKEAAIAEDAFAKEHGLQQPKPGQRDNRIPYLRVKSIVGNAETKLAKALGVEIPEGKSVQEAITAHVARNAERETTFQQYEAKVNEVKTIERIMEENPEQFLSLLPHVNPKYTELLGGKKEAAVVPSDKPKPDVDLGEGRWTYSPDGLEKLMAWQAAETAKSVKAEFNERLTPFEKQRDTDAVIAQASQAVDAQLAEARTEWEGFKDHEDAILTAMRTDRLAAEKVGKRSRMNLQTAYIKVVVPKLKANREKMRLDLIEEGNKRKTSTSTVVTTPAKKKAVDENLPNPGGTEAVIKAALDKIR